MRVAGDVRQRVLGGHRSPCREANKEPFRYHRRWLFQASRLAVWLVRIREVELVFVFSNLGGNAAICYPCFLVGMCFAFVGFGMVVRGAFRQEDTTPSRPSTDICCMLWRCRSGLTTLFGLRYSSVDVNRSIIDQNYKWGEFSPTIYWCLILGICFRLWGTIFKVFFTPHIIRLYGVLYKTNRRKCIKFQYSFTFLIFMHTGDGKVNLLIWLTIAIPLAASLQLITANMQ